MPSEESRGHTPRGPSDVSGLVRLVVCSPVIAWGIGYLIFINTTKPPLIWGVSWLIPMAVSVLLGLICVYITLLLADRLIAKPADGGGNNE